MISLIRQPLWAATFPQGKAFGAQGSGRSVYEGDIPVMDDGGIIVIPYEDIIHNQDGRIAGLSTEIDIKKCVIHFPCQSVSRTKNTPKGMSQYGNEFLHRHTFSNGKEGTRR